MHFRPRLLCGEIVYVLSAWKRRCAGMVRHIIGLDAKGLQHFFNTTGNGHKKRAQAC